jgi:PPOX class probable F420-dependent enzyme
MLPDDVRELLAGVNFAHLATLLPDGSPHTVPLWVDVEGDRVAVLTDPRSRKARNIDNDSRVALSITDHARPHTMATIRGRVADRVDGDAGWAIIDRIAHKYTGQPYPLRTDRVALLIEVTHAKAIAYG